ncbi:MAG: NTP transferase domain-containing protein [Planctomycetes bacterium]|nr:NTP transferase domain-containing protein [Planctomycetota bacterium]
MAKRAAVILAAGVSSRMNTMLPKVLHEVCGRPMLSYVLDACRAVDVEKIYVVVGYGADQVKERYGGHDDIVWVTQAEQKGTAHAVMCCKDELAGFDGDTLVLCGDGPLIRKETLKTLVDKHDSEQSATTLATAVLDDPSGYGRICRDSYGNIQGIVEDSDCDEKQLAIQEVNPSYYLFKNKILLEALEKVEPNNVKNEYYITDVLAIVLAAGHKVVAITAVRPEEAIGVNSRRQLSEVGRIMQDRVQDELMDGGVTIVDPDNTWIDARAQIGQDTVIEPFTYIHGIANIGKSCRIGPFAYLRNDTVIEDDVVLGVFTEVKDSVLGAGVRARHLNYIGDSEIGKNVNIGAGTITANFDGENINKTKIGDDSYVGSGVVIVAPVELAKGSKIESGTVVSKNSLIKPLKG